MDTIIPISTLKISLKKLIIPTVRLDIHSFTTKKIDEASSVSSLFLQRQQPRISLFVVVSFNCTSFNLRTRSLSCPGNVEIMFLILMYNSGINKLNNATIKVIKKTMDIKIPTERDSFSACPSLESFFLIPESNIYRSYLQSD